MNQDNIIINETFEKLNFILDKYIDLYQQRSIEEKFFKNLSHWTVVSNKSIRKFSNEALLRQISKSSSNITILTSKDSSYIFMLELYPKSDIF